MKQTQEEQLNKIKLELKRLEEIRANNNWRQVRDVKNYEVIRNDYDWDSKPAFKIPEDKYQLYIDLQASRGLKTSVFTEDGVENFLDTCREQCDLEKEIKEGISKGNYIDDYQRAIELGELDFSQIDNFIELGFRSARLLDFYSKKGISNCIGYDVVELNILVAEYLGYQSDFFDLNKCDKKFFKFSPKSLIVSYHSLEHTSNPLKAIKYIYDSMHSGSLFHVEVPIESNREYPNVRYAHLYAFQNFELMKMLQSVGFKIMNTTMRSLTNPIERYLVHKQ